MDDGLCGAGGGGEIDGKGEVHRQAAEHGECADAEPGDGLRFLLRYGWGRWGGAVAAAHGLFGEGGFEIGGGPGGVIFEFFAKRGDAFWGDGWGGVSPCGADVGDDGGDFSIVEGGSLGGHGAVPCFSVDDDFTDEAVEDGEDDFLFWAGDPV